jgi:L-asparaginase II
MARPHAAPSLRTDSLVAGPPDNPVLTRVWRGAHVESQHRGAWVLVDSAGNALDGAGEPGQGVFARSSIKSLQALPLCETGAAERHGYGDDELALALASHDGEAIHTERVERLLRRLGLGVEHLQCGPQAPGSSVARDALRSSGTQPSALHNNCSGKHAGFLALSLHLGVDPVRYLDPAQETQRLVRRAVEEMTGAAPSEIATAVDGCSAPTFRVPLAKLATAIARVANPEGLQRERRAACERMQRAVAVHPELIAGTRRRLCTDLARASGGRLFPKIGGEAVYLIGAVGRDRGLAIKIDDGSYRGFQALIVELCARWGWLDASQTAALEAWRDRALVNWAGRAVGRVEVVA